MYATNINKQNNKILLKLEFMIYKERQPIILKIMKEFIYIFKIINMEQQSQMYCNFCNKKYPTREQRIIHQRSKHHNQQSSMPIKQHPLKSDYNNFIDENFNLQQFMIRVDSQQPDQFENLHRKANYYLYTKFYQQALTMYTQWLKKLKQYKIVFTGQYFSAGLDLMMVNCNSDKYQCGLIHLYMEMIQNINANLYNPLTPLGFIIRKLAKSKDKSTQETFINLEDTISKCFQRNQNEQIQAQSMINRYLYNLLGDLLYCKLEYLSRIKRNQGIINILESIQSLYRQSTHTNNAQPYLYSINKKKQQMKMQRFRQTTNNQQFRNSYQKYFWIHMIYLEITKKINKNKTIKMDQIRPLYVHIGIFVQIINQLYRKAQSNKQPQSNNSYKQLIQNMIKDLLQNRTWQQNNQFLHPGWLIQFVRFLHLKEYQACVLESINKQEVQEIIEKWGQSNEYKGRKIQKLAYNILTKYTNSNIHEKYRNEQIKFALQQLELSILRQSSQKINLFGRFESLCQFCKRINQTNNHTPYLMLGQQYYIWKDYLKAKEYFQTAQGLQLQIRDKARVWRQLVAVYYKLMQVNKSNSQLYQRYKQKTKQYLNKWQQVLNQISLSQQNYYHEKRAYFLKAISIQSNDLIEQQLKKSIDKGNISAYMKMAQLLDLNSQKKQQYLRKCLKDQNCKQQAYYDLLLVIKQDYLDNPDDINKLIKLEQITTEIQQFFKKDNSEKDPSFLNNYCLSRFTVIVQKIKINEQSNEMQQNTEYKEQLENLIKLLEQSLKRKMHKKQIAEQQKINSQTIQLQICVVTLNIIIIKRFLCKFTRKQYMDYQDTILSAQRIHKLAQQNRIQSIINLSYHEFLTNQFTKISQNEIQYNQQIQGLYQHIQNSIQNYYRLQSQVNEIKDQPQRDRIIIQILQTIYQNRNDCFQIPKNQVQKQKIQQFYHSLCLKVKQLCKYGYEYFQFFSLTLSHFFSHNCMKIDFDQMQQDQLNKQIIKINKYLQQIIHQIKTNEQYRQIPEGHDFKGQSQKLQQNFRELKKMEEQNKHQSWDLFERNNIKLQDIKTIENLRDKLIQTLNKTDANSRLNNLLFKFAKQLGLKTDKKRYTSYKVDLLSNFSRFARVFQKMFKKQIKQIITEKLVKSMKQRCMKQRCMKQRQNTQEVSSIQLQKLLYKSLKQSLEEELFQKQIHCNVSDLVRGQLIVNQKNKLNNIFEYLLDQCVNGTQWKVLQAEDRTGIGKKGQKNNHDYVFKLLYTEPDSSMICQVRFAPQFQKQEYQHAFHFGHELYEIQRSVNLGNIFGCFLNIAKNYSKGPNVLVCVKKLLQKQQNQQNKDENRINALRWFHDLFT